VRQANFATSRLALRTGRSGAGSTVQGVTVCSYVHTVILILHPTQRMYVCMYVVRTIQTRR
jgi:hypothetical protein